MADRRRTSGRIVAPAGASVKSKIVGAGIPMRRLAAEIRMAPSTLSDYLAGRIRCADGQLTIWLAFRRLTGQTLSARALWGKLLSEEAA